jgi:DNA-binding HxlR family transcriptional regulator
MDSYGQFCPVAQAAEIITRRWMPLVVRELLFGSYHFNDLHRGVPRMSRSLLVRRMNELEETGLLERRLVEPAGHPEYHLTQAGEDLRPIIIQLGLWGKQWVQREVSREKLDAGLLMWDMQRRIQKDRLPPQRIVIYFHFTDAPKQHQHFWLLLEQDDVDLCLKDPGCEEDLYVRSDVRTLTDVWLGDVSITQALQEGVLRLGGTPALRRAFPEWLGLSLFAGMIRQPRQDQGRVPALLKSGTPA